MSVLYRFLENVGKNNKKHEFVLDVRGMLYIEVLRMKRIIVCLTILLFVCFSKEQVVKGSSAFSKTVNDVTVTAKEEEAGNLQEFVVQIGKQMFIKPEWKSDSNPAFHPKVEKTDIDHDGKEEVFISLTTGRGTSMYIEEPHIFKQDKEGLYDEVDIENPIHVLKKEVIANRKGRDITIRIGEKEWNIVVPKGIPENHLFENVFYGSRAKYKTKNNEFIGEISAHITPDYYLGKFNIRYEYKNNLFYVKHISFKKET